MTKKSTLVILCLISYSFLMFPFSRYLHNKPVVEKIGYIPSNTALRIVAADHKELLGAALVMKAMMYYGGLIEMAANRVVVDPDYQSMSIALHRAVQLDPYNMDAYYFAQSFLTWEAKQFKLANDLLEYGMKYRTWDWYLPFYAGFNNAFFLKDFKKAADYYQRAGELSGSDLSRLLAGRYMLESGHTELAIKYLTAMERVERNQPIKKSYQIRIAAFKEVLRIESARDRYLQANGKLPQSYKQLVQEKFLDPEPDDPYGGEFYLESDGKVSSTSKFAFVGVKK